MENLTWWEKVAEKWESWEEREREKTNIASHFDNPLRHSKFLMEVTADDDECDNAR